MDDPRNRTPAREILDPFNPSKHDEKAIAAFSPFRRLSSRTSFFIILSFSLSVPLLLSSSFFLSHGFRLLPTYVRNTPLCARQLHRHPLVRGKTDRQFTLEYTDMGGGGDGGWWFRVLFWNVNRISTRREWNNWSTGFSRWPSHFFPQLLERAIFSPLLGRTSREREFSFFFIWRVGVDTLIVLLRILENQFGSGSFNFSKHARCLT